MSCAESLSSSTRAVPAGGDRARKRVVLEVEEVVGQPWMPASHTRHVRVSAVQLTLPGDEPGERATLPQLGQVRLTQSHLQRHGELHKSNGSHRSQTMLAASVSLT